MSIRTDKLNYFLGIDYEAQDQEKHKSIKP